MQPSSAQAYGAAPAKVPAKLFLKARRKSMNIVALCQSIFLPWLLFCVVSALSCFWLRYKEPAVAAVLNIVCFLVPLGFGVCAYRAWTKKREQDEDWYPAWYFYLFLMTLLAWVFGYAWGTFNFTTNFKPYFDLQHLNAYVDVDVNVDDGLNIMDAGTVVFKPGTAIDFKHSMGFKNVETWCAAPLILGTKPPKSYDFWVVGKNCCGGSPTKFQCPNYNNPKAHSGLRAMQDEDRPFYRLAVQQAQANFQIPVHHPLFFFWTEDAGGGAGLDFGLSGTVSGTFGVNGGESFGLGFSANGMGMAASQEVGFKNYLLGMFVFFLGNLLLALIASCCFAKAGIY